MISFDDQMANLLAELEALEMTAKAIESGAVGVDMGRNIFQSEDPVAMIQAVREVVHKNASPKEAFEVFNQLRSKSGAGNPGSGEKTRYPGTD